MVSTYSKADLEHSNDYRISTCNGQRLYNGQRLDNRQRLYHTRQQAANVRVLPESPYYEASTQIIKKQTKCGPIHNSFKSGDGPEIWEKVIVNHPKGFYRLNLTPKND